MKIEISNTADGSPTLYRADIDEHYHSVKGALAESLHVYIVCGWRKAELRGGPLTVFEVGFGTGLNAALTAEVALESKVPTIYYSVELYPLPMEMTVSLAHTLSENLQKDILAVNEAPWDMPVEINTYFTLHKIHGDFTIISIPKDIDVVYFDAFAPEKQPEMWDMGIFMKLYEAMTPDGILTTYCAKGAIRRMLSDIGFICERLPGPPAGKREILRVTKPILPHDF